MTAVVDVSVYGCVGVCMCVYVCEWAGLMVEGAGLRFDVLR